MTYDSTMSRNDVIFVGCDVNSRTELVSSVDLLRTREAAAARRIGATIHCSANENCGDKLRAFCRFAPRGQHPLSSAINTIQISKGPSERRSGGFSPAIQMNVGLHIERRTVEAHTRSISIRSIDSCDFRGCPTLFKNFE